jgi:hypothetical protein
MRSHSFCIQLARIDFRNSQTAVLCMGLRANQPRTRLTLAVHTCLCRTPVRYQVYGIQSITLILNHKPKNPNPKP